jgi:hypothetical protein
MVDYEIPEHGTAKRRQMSDITESDPAAAQPKRMYERNSQYPAAAGPSRDIGVGLNNKIGPTHHVEPFTPPILDIKSGTAS